MESTLFWRDEYPTPAKDIVFNAVVNDNVLYHSLF
jgi:hypothetical protein